MAYRCKLNQNQECNGCGYCMLEPEEVIEKECCGTCRWNVHDKQDEEMVCVNENSNYYLDDIDKKHSCADYEKQE